MPTLKDLVRQGREYYPTKHLRKQWVRKSIQLFQSGRHALLTGGFVRGTH